VIETNACIELSEDEGIGREEKEKKKLNEIAC
jgi:hypothetical protein